MQKYNPVKEYIRQLNIANDDKAREVLELIDSGKTRPGILTIIARRAITGSNVEFVKDSESKKVGLRSLELGKLPVEIVAMPYRVSLKAVHQTSNPFTDSELQTSRYVGLHQLNSGNGFGLQNGELSVRVGGSDLIRELSLNTLNEQEGIDTPIGALDFDASELIYGGKKIDPVFKMPEGIDAPDFIGLEFTMTCIANYSKSY